MNQKTSSLKQEIVCIIPTLNECDTVVEVIRKAQQFTPHIVVVDGHSNDDTCERAKVAGAKILYQEGKGKGWALRTAFSQLKSDIYVTIDGDATYDARELINLVQPIIDGTDPPSLKFICEKYGITDEAKASNMTITVKRRFQVTLKKQLRDSVVSVAQIDGELEEIKRFFPKIAQDGE